MSKPDHTSLPYCMGNAGDLLKHGVLAEYICWRNESGSKVRFLDLFGGEPVQNASPDEVVRRVQGLTGSALHDAQPEIAEGRYLGSGMLVHHFARSLRNSRIQVFTADSDTERRKKLMANGLQVLDELPSFSDTCSSTGEYDAYTFFKGYASQSEEQDLVLIDPFAGFLSSKSHTVIPQIEIAAKRASVLLFALNRDPFDSVGRQFDDLLETHLKGAVIMTCPPLRDSCIDGESEYYAEIVLAAHALNKDSYARDALLTRLDFFSKQLGGVLGLSDRSRPILKPRIIGRN
ncbi:MAG: hypothetical protein OXI37_10785 [Gammaproteobacteria bacterium]|nr:hypothetical protein [Gammaproteobacteria bacterium]